MAGGTTARHLVCLSSVDKDKASPHWQKNSMYTHSCRASVDAVGSEK